MNYKRSNSPKFSSLPIIFNCNFAEMALICCKNEQTASVQACLMRICVASCKIFLSKMSLYFFDYYFIPIWIIWCSTLGIYVSYAINCSKRRYYSVENFTVFGIYKIGDRIAAPIQSKCPDLCSQLSGMQETTLLYPEQCIWHKLVINALVNNHDITTKSNKALTQT